ncbi:MAG: SH3 domain-containing protein, partial [Lachnospiraceae bacterium]|nr:SH3 domain-containing protein [Lachnospiraceae bacterium]
MKKRISLVLALMMSVTVVLAGCGDKEEEAATEVTEVPTEISIVSDVEDSSTVSAPEPATEEVYDFGQVNPEDIAATVSEPQVEETVEEAEPQTDEFGVTAMADAKMYAKEKVRIRREPNTDSEIAGNLNTGDEVTVNGKTDEWSRISKNGENLYVKSEYLTDTKPEKTEETADADQNADAQTTDANAAATTTTDAAAQQAADAAAQTAAAQQAANDEAASQAAAAAAAAAATTSAASYDVNGLKVTAEEYKVLLDTWRWATANGTDEEAREYV